MKKTISIVLVCVLLLGCVMSLTSCDKFLFGKYTADLALTKVTYEFSGLNKVIVTNDPIVGDTTTKEGTYKITEDNEGNPEIVITIGEEVEALSYSTGEEDGVKYIKIGGVRYNKAD